MEWPYCQYLQWGDALDDALLDPVHQVLLLHAAVQVLKRHLVVQPLLHLIGHHVQPLPVIGLQQHSNIVLMEDGKRSVTNLDLVPL